MYVYALYWLPRKVSGNFVIFSDVLKKKMKKSWLTKRNFCCKIWNMITSIRKAFCERDIATDCSVDDGGGGGDCSSGSDDDG